MAKIKSFKPKLTFKRDNAQNTNNNTQVEVRPHIEFEPQPQQKVPQGKFQPVRLIPLGGVGDVTKNMYVYEFGNDIIIVDCGIGFPEEGMLGIDLVIPDVSYLKDKRDRIKGVVITHGHEDHIGGLPYLWPQLECPIYAQPLPAGFIKSKFIEHNLPKDTIKVIDIDTKLDLGAFKVSFYRSSHSVPDAAGVIIDTPVGRIIHQADFKLDWTPVSGEVMDVGKIALAGENGVLLLLIDGLGIEKHGYTMSELPIEDTFTVLEEKTAGKMVVTTNSSNITRMQQLINVAVRSNRKVALAGRSMENNFQVARDLGYLDVPAGIIIAQDEIKRFKDNQLMVIIAGSQGQPGSALSRAANHNHKFIQLKQGDSVVFSASPIPSSQLEYFALVDQLVKMGLEVFYTDITNNLHVSGHAAAEEIKLMVHLAKPDFVMPIGATIRGMKVFKDTMIDMGYKNHQVIIPDNGQVIEITPNRVDLKGRVEAKNVYVDGLGVGDIGQVVLRDRQVMAEEGIVMVVVPVDSQSGTLVGDVDLVSRGFVFEKEAGGLLDDAKKLVTNVLTDNQEMIKDWRFTRRQIEDALDKFFYEETKRRPMILPIVVNV